MMKKGIVTLLDENKHEIEKISINKLPFKKEVIIRKSIEVYEEEDPCIIYSTFCSNILGDELLAKINLKSPGSENNIFDVDDTLYQFKNTIELNENVKFIKIE